MSVAVDAQKKLLEKGVDVRVVSMPSWELFEEQDEAYKDSVLCLPWDRRISVEMLSTFGWDRYSKHHMGLDRFGTSGPAKDVIKHFNFTADHLAETVESLVK